MILSGNEIKRQRDAGNLLIEPYDQRCKQPNGWEVRLGPWWFKPNRGMHRYEPWGESSQREYWGAPQVPNANEGKSIAIPPKTVILAHTLEWIGALRDYVPYLRCRSGVARSSATICACAGFGETGYAYRWTLEIENRTDAVMVLPVGVRVGQVVFSPLETGGYEDQDLYTGSYGKPLHAWTPYDCLPKLYNDTDLPGIESAVSRGEWEQVRKYENASPAERLAMFGQPVYSGS